MSAARLFWPVAAILVSLGAGDRHPARAETGDCDRLAGDAVAMDAIDPAAAQAACLEALADSPADPQYLYQYARAVERGGDPATARRLYEWSADQGFGPAEAALARLGGEAATPDAAAGETAPAPGTIELLAASLGPDPAAILAWVAGSIAADGYAGVMRGAAGTLAAGSGNAADRALLVAALVRAADPAAEVRFAECRLPDSETAALAKSVVAARPARQELLLEVAGRFAPEMADPEARRVAEGLGAIWRDAVASVERQSDELAAALADEAGAIGAAMPREALLDALSRHVWVQAMSAGAWTDLDPTVPGAAPGLTRCNAETTVDMLADDAYHRLNVQVVLEERAGDTLATRPILDASVRTADLASGTLSFMFAESVGRGSHVPERPEPEAGYLAYTPLLVAGGEEHIGESFALPAPLSTPADESMGDVIGGAMFDVFGEPPPEEPPAERPEGNVTAAWLKLTLSAPDGTVESATGMLFDRVGFARRTAGTVAGPLEVLPEVDGEYQALGTIWDIALAQGVPPAPDSDEAEPAYDDMDPLDILLAELGRLHSVWEPYRAALFAAAAPVGAPRMLALRPGLTLLGWVPAAGEDNLAQADLMMDVLTDPAMTPPGWKGDRRAAIAWAVGTVVAERLTIGMERLFPALVGIADVPAFRPLDVPVVFDAARSQGVPLAWLGPDAPDGPLVEGSEEAIARIRAHSAAGLSLLVPTRAVATGGGTVLGWWLLDPATGALRDEFENGRHADMVERPITEEPARKSTPAYRSLGQRVCLMVNRAIGVISLGIAIASGDPSALKGAWTAGRAERKVARAIERTRRTAEKAAEQANRNNKGCK